MTTAIEERNMQSVHEQMQCLNAHDVDCFLQFLAPDFVWRSDLIPVPHQGIEAAREGLHQIFTVFPDIRFDEIALYPGGETVTGVFEVSGTQIDPGPGSILPPVHDHPWHMNQAIIHTFDADGKMQMVWLFANVAALLQQLGFVSPNLHTFGKTPEQRIGNAMGAMGFDPWSPAGSGHHHDPRTQNTIPGTEAGFPSGLIPPAHNSFLLDLMGLPLRMLYSLLVALESGLGITPPGPGSPMPFGAGGGGCTGCGGN